MAVVAIVVGVIVGMPSEQAGPEPQQFASAVGDVAVYELPDTSLVALDTNTVSAMTYALVVEKQDPADFAAKWVAENGDAVDAWLK